MAGVKFLFPRPGPFKAELNSRPRLPLTQPMSLCPPQADRVLEGFAKSSSTKDRRLADSMPLGDQWPAPTDPLVHILESNTLQSTQTGGGGWEVDLGVGAPFPTRCASAPHSRTSCASQQSWLLEASFFHSAEFTSDSCSASSAHT